MLWNTHQARLAGLVDVVGGDDDRCRPAPRDAHQVVPDTATTDRLSVRSKVVQSSQATKLQLLSVCKSLHLYLQFVVQWTPYNPVLRNFGPSSNLAV